ncbi:pyridoxal-phosphate dependent enzyme [Paludibacterium sp. B53371]|uniref:pyridoxal-phosphate dependent enzyme n=1 Tax=Paludibacterium sp. B53371 TaxID=2806263 RepID=UPI00207B1C93|nr:pyridoxal-phosphate dependent enzyme [Paludibacterium sp. B53371]
MPATDIQRYPSERPFPFARAVAAGDFLFLSGQVAMSASGEPLPGDVASQTHHIMQAIQRTLQHCGTDLDAVVKVSVWLSDMQHFAAFNQAYRHYFPRGLPARSVVSSRLAFDLDVEIEVQAYHPAPRSTPMPLHIATPHYASRPLSEAAGRTVWLKLEALQPPGSFKLRGIGHACQTYRARGAQRFISSSGGNAGLAVAYAGRQLGVPVTVVVPQTTSERAKQLLRQENAQVIVHGASWQEANEHAQSLLGEHDAFLHPFDDPLLWQGHATMIDEVAQSGLRPDAIVLSVGGGGLLCGVIEGLQRNGWQDIPVLAVETEGTASLHAALQAGEHIALEQISGIATSLGAKRVCDRAWQYTQTHPIQSLVVSDDSALSACRQFLDDHRLLVEPACGASLAVAYQNHPALQPYQHLLIIVCGGATASIEQIRQ